MIGSVHAQVAKHTSKETYSDNSNSGGSRTTYRSSSNSNEYSESTNRQTYKSSNTDYHSESSRSSNENSFYRVDKLESNQPAKTIDFNSLKLNKVEKETPKGGIKKVDTEPQLYLEDKKDDVIVPFNGDSNLEVDSYVETEEEKVMPAGLSQNTTTLKNNGLRINGTIVTCDDFRTGRNRRWEILSRYEMYDLSMVKRCLDNFPKDDRWIITCDEFEKSDDTRKMHLLNNSDFYNLDDLKNCESYKTFKANLPVETEE